MKVKMDGELNQQTYKMEYYNGELYIDSVDYIYHYPNFKCPIGYKAFKIGDVYYYIENCNVDELISKFDIQLIHECNNFAMCDLFIKSNKVISKHEEHFDNNSDKYDYDVYILKSGISIGSPMRNYEHIGINRKG